MALMVLDPGIEGRLLEDRRRWGADRYDEIWKGVYVMAPLPDDEHQEIVGRLVRVIDQVLGDPGVARVRPGVSLAGRDVEDWTTDFRVPDVAVFLERTHAQNLGSHWRGPADFLVEITSPGDQTRDKIPFYAALGVVELLIVDPDGWRIELYRHDGSDLRPVGASSAGQPIVLPSEQLSLTFEVVPGAPRPRIRVADPSSGRSWDV